MPPWKVPFLGTLPQAPTEAPQRPPPIGADARTLEIDPTNLYGLKNGTFGGFLKWGYPQIIHFKGFSTINHPFLDNGNPH